MDPYLVVGLASASLGVLGALGTWLESRYLNRDHDTSTESSTPS